MENGNIPPKTRPDHRAILELYPTIISLSCLIFAAILIGYSVLFYDRGDIKGFMFLSVMVFFNLSNAIMSLLGAR